MCLLHSNSIEMSRQLNMAQWAKPNANTPKYSSSLSHNVRLCPYCDRCFSSQGYGVHIKTHQLDPNARPWKKSKLGRVKLRDTLPNNDSGTSDTSPPSQDQRISSDAEPSDTAPNDGVDTTDDANIESCADDGFESNSDERDRGDDVADVANVRKRRTKTITTWRRKTTNVFVPTVALASCRVNKSCSLIRCKQCCVEYCYLERKTCKCKDHQKATSQKPVF